MPEPGDAGRMHPLPPDAQAAVRQGDLMKAIELTRAATGMDLGASMQAVVAHATEEGVQGPDTFDRLLAGDAASSAPEPARVRHLSVTTTTTTVNGRTVSRTVSRSEIPPSSDAWVRRHRGRAIAVAAAVVVAVIAIGLLYELARGFLYQR